MDQILKNIDKKKKDSIINGALQEFALRGFKQASTNKMVDNAGISKGLLFHYFGSKRGLYHALLAFSRQMVTFSIREKLDWEQTDLFCRMQEVVLIKASVTNEYPYLYEFMTTAYRDASYEELDLVKDQEIIRLTKDIYTKNIDYASFKKNLDVDKALEIVRWTFDGYGKALWERIKKEKVLDMLKIVQETDVYIDMLRQAFYE